MRASNEVFIDSMDSRVDKLHDVFHLRVDPTIFSKIVRAIYKMTKIWEKYFDNMIKNNEFYFDKMNADNELFVDRMDVRVDKFYDRFNKRVNPKIFSIIMREIYSMTASCEEYLDNKLPVDPFPCPDQDSVPNHPGNLESCLTDVDHAQEIEQSGIQTKKLKKINKTPLPHPEPVDSSKNFADFFRQMESEMLKMVQQANQKSKSHRSTSSRSRQSSARKSSS